MVDRHRPAKDMIRLIQLLSGHKASGLSVEDISAKLEISERSTRRYLSALQDIEPDLSFHEEENHKKFWYLPTTQTRMPAVTAEQLSSLTAIANFIHMQGHLDYAQMLQGLRDSLQSGLDRATQARLDPDLEILDASVEVTHYPGPKASLDPVIRRQILSAINREKQIQFHYTSVFGRSTTDRVVSPYALVVGRRAYLVARDERAKAIRNFVLTGISALRESDIPATREGFDARAYVRQSFGAFHDGKFHQWTLRFRETAAHSLVGYQFHPTQTMTKFPNGEIEVSFYCESIREVAYECFRWSDHLSAIGPADLRGMVDEICREMAAACQT